MIGTDARRSWLPFFESTSGTEASTQKYVPYIIQQVQYLLEDEARMKKREKKKLLAPTTDITHRPKATGSANQTTLTEEKN